MRGRLAGGSSPGIGSLDPGLTDAPFTRNGLRDRASDGELPATLLFDQADRRVAPATAAVALAFSLRHLAALDFLGAFGAVLGIAWAVMMPARERCERLEGRLRELEERAG